MQIALDMTTLRPATLAAIAADITLAIDAQDWTNTDEVNTARTIIAHLYTIPGLPARAVDDLLADAGADPEVEMDLLADLIVADLVDLNLWSKADGETI